MDVGGTEPLIVVTNSSLVRVDSLYIIACVDAIVPAPDPDGVIVKQTVVGGRKSEGIICDAPMLGWGSSNSGVPVYLNEGEYTPGDTPPSSKPRPGGMMGGFEEALPVVEQEVRQSEEQSDELKPQSQAVGENRTCSYLRTKRTLD